MKKLIIILALFSTQAFAGGKIIVEGAHKFNTVHYHPYVVAMGLAAYEPITKNLSYEFYTGVGQQDRIINGVAKDLWLATKADLNYKIGNFTVSAGATMKLLTDDYRNNNDAHMQLACTIW